MEEDEAGKQNEITTIDEEPRPLRASGRRNENTTSSKIPQAAI